MLYLFHSTSNAASAREAAMIRGFIGLGANLDDRLRSLQHAVKCLDDTGGMQVTKVSSVYETEPVGPVDQPWFLNAVAEIDTCLSPAALLAQTQAIEGALGRVATSRWGPRTIDLDILLYGDRRIATTTLVIPHPELCQRAFAMIPLLELDPQLTLPDGTAIRACLSALTPCQYVRLFAPAAALAYNQS
jgi:2-amino-4-hydroxy-6-hydroxymethyldihydropteridine diphosphokinase